MRSGRTTRLRTGDGRRRGQRSCSTPVPSGAVVACLRWAFSSAWRMPRGDWASALYRLHRWARSAGGIYHPARVLYPPASSRACVGADDGDLFMAPASIRRDLSACRAIPAAGADAPNGVVVADDGGHATLQQTLAIDKRRAAGAALALVGGAGDAVAGEGGGRRVTTAGRDGRRGAAGTIAPWTWRLRLLRLSAAPKHFTAGSSV